MDELEIKIALLIKYQKKVSHSMEFCEVFRKIKTN